MSDQLFSRPPLVGLGGPHAAGGRDSAAPARPKTDEPTGETMAIGAHAANVFDGAPPKEGDIVEFVCVRANVRGWGLQLRVKSAQG